MFQNIIFLFSNFEFDFNEYLNFKMLHFLGLKFEFYYNLIYKFKRFTLFNCIFYPTCSITIFSVFVNLNE